jgi:hypothetical protein
VSGRPLANLGEVPQRLCYSTRSFYNRPFMYRLIAITHSCCYCSRHVKSSHWCFSHLAVIAGPGQAIDLQQLTFQTSPASSIRHCESKGVFVCLGSGVWGLGSGAVDLSPFVSDCLFVTAKNFACVHTTIFVLLSFIGVGNTYTKTRSRYEFSNAFNP